jgi:hypothetical protein
MSASEDYTIEFSTPFTITAKTSEIKIKDIGDYYGYADTNVDPTGVLVPNTSIVLTGVQATQTTSATFEGEWYYVIDDSTAVDGRTATKIETYPFRLSDLSNCALRFVPTTNEDGYAKFTFLFYSSILIQPPFITAALPSPITDESGYITDYCAIQWNYKHINYAPTINAINIDLSSTSFDLIKTDPSGTTLASIIGRDGLGYGEPNSLDVRGLALIGIEYKDPSGVSIDPFGTWQYKRGAAGAWTDLTFADGDAYAYYFKEESAVSVRFFPTDNKNARAVLRFRAWDSSTGAEAYQTAKAFGGNNSTSEAIATVTIPVIKVNYKPILKNQAYTAPAILEDLTDASNNGFVLNDAFFDLTTGIGLAADTDPKRGIVITGLDDKSNGVWQFYNGSAWAAIDKTQYSAVPSRALHLLETTNGLSPAIRFKPSKDKNGTAQFTYSAWSGLNAATIPSGTYAAVDGGNSYSLESGTATLTITPVEDSPDLSGTKTNVLVRSYNQSVIPAVGKLKDGINVADTILKRFTIVDVDTSANQFGVVITGVDISGDLSGVSFSAADFRISFVGSTGIDWASANSDVVFSDIVSGKGIYLPPDADFRIKQPVNFVGRLIFTFYLWNATVLSTINTNQLENFNYSALTNKEHYSVGTGSFRVFYADINDPPVLSTTSVNLNALFGSQAEDTLNPLEMPVATIMTALTITDSDANTQVSIPAAGLAFYDISFSAPDFAGKKSYLGDWYYKPTPSSAAVLISGLSTSNAFHLIPNGINNRLLFKPAQNVYGTFTIKAYAWDRSNEDNVADKTYAATDNTTDTSPYSANSVTFSLTVGTVNDRPGLIGVSPTTRIRFTDINRNAFTNMGDILATVIEQIRPVVKDEDPLDNFGIAVSSASATSVGTWQYSIRDIAGIPQWTSFPSLNINMALHLRPNNNTLTGEITRIRFLPRSLASFQTMVYYVWDMSNGITNGTRTMVNLSSTAYSMSTLPGLLRIT